jgi:molecular chaperone GrpE
MNSHNEFNTDIQEDCCTACPCKEQVAADDQLVDTHDQALKQCQKDVELWKDKYVRMQADLDNVRRRMYKEQEQAIWRTQADIFIPLLRVMDGFDQAQHAMTKFEANSECQSMMSGISLIRKELVALFDRFDVKEIDASGEFDPSLHEAISAAAATDEHPAGTIVALFQKGYTYKGQVLRVAKVSVAQ